MPDDPEAIKKNQRYLDAILSGEREAVQQLYDDHLPTITRYVCSNSGTKADAFDIFQAALLVIFRKARHRGGLTLTASFGTFLYAICRNLWLQKLKKNRRQGVTFDEEEGYMDTDNIETVLEEEERYRLYRAKFRELSQGCQQVLRLFFDKTPMEEIARIMGFGSEAYAKKRKYQCKEKLIALIQNDSQFNEL